MHGGVLTSDSDPDFPNLEKKNGAVLYLITPTNNMPRSYKTKARRQYYLENPKLNSRNVRNQKHWYTCKDNNVCLRNHDIHYDEKKGFIQLNKIQLKQPIRVHCKFTPAKVCRCCSN